MDPLKNRTLKELCIRAIAAHHELLSALADKIHLLPKDVSDSILQRLPKADETIMVFLAASSQSLDLSLSPLVTESGLKHLTHYHNINTLTLVHCKVTLEGINDAALGIISSLSSLRHLNLTGCLNITDEGVAKLASLPLQTLILAHCKKLIGSCLKELCRRLVDILLVLDLSYIEGLSERNMKSLRDLKKLQTLGLSFVKIADSPLGKIVSECSELRSLNVNFCSQLTDHFISRLCKSGVNLKEVHLANCNLTDSDVQKICGALLKLEVLDISWNSKLTDSALSKISKLKSLNVLNLMHTPLSAKVIKQVESDVPHIKQILFCASKKSSQ